MTQRPPHHRATFWRSTAIAIGAAATLVMLWAPVVTAVAPGAVTDGLIAGSMPWTTAGLVGVTVGALHALGSHPNRRRHARHGDCGVSDG